MEIYGGTFIVGVIGLVVLVPIWLRRTLNPKVYPKRETDIIALACTFFFIAVSVSIFDPVVKKLDLSKGWSTGVLLAITFALFFIAGAFIERVYLPRKRKQQKRNELRITPPDDPSSK